MKKDPFKSMAIGFGLLLFVVVALWIYSRYHEIRLAVIDKKQAETVAYVQDRVSTLVRQAVFTSRESRRQRQAFQSFFDAIRSPELIGIRVWDRNSILLWSNIDELVGQGHPENSAAREALIKAGNADAELPPLSLFSEARFDRLSRTYVSLFDARGEIVGVVEVFQPTRWLQEEIRSQFQSTALPVVVFMIIGYGALLILLCVLMAPKNLSVGESPV